MEDYVGTIRLFGGNYAPANWALCQGQTLSASQYPNLFTVIGYTYGGSGANFNLPNLNNAAPVGAGTSTTGTTYNLGSAGGSAAVTLVPANLPAHAHMLIGGMEAPANSDAVDGPNPENSYPGAASSNIYGPASNAHAYMAPATTDITLQSTPPQQNAPIQNMMPSLGVTYIIALDGGGNQMPL